MKRNSFISACPMPKPFSKRWPIPESAFPFLDFTSRRPPHSALSFERLINWQLPIRNPDPGDYFNAARMASSLNPLINVPLTSISGMPRPPSAS